jgi:glycosyltransferase involved in cell wall biosynthesis
MIVGTNSLEYNQKRNFADLPFVDVEFRKVLDAYKVPSYLTFKLTHKISRMSYRFNDLGLNKVDLYHFWNTITPVRKPWITTFEHTIPRNEPNFLRGYEWMAGCYCKKLIAITQRAINGQKFALNNYHQYKDEIEAKMICIPPPQKVICKVPTVINDKIIFTFIGNAFYRKGGVELVKAFAALKKYPIHLNLISKMQFDGFKDRFAEPFHESMPSNVSYFPWLPNDRVIKILTESHVGILPSYGETYGYSVLEAMAAGCAVVTTDVDPFPEFVKEDFGYFLKMPKYIVDGFERIESDTPESFNQCSTHLVNEITRVIQNIVNDLETLQVKRENAIKRIGQYHSPIDRSNLLLHIYLEAIGMVRS